MGEKVKTAVEEASPSFPATSAKRKARKRPLRQSRRKAAANMHPSDKACLLIRSKLRLFMYLWIMVGLLMAGLTVYIVYSRNTEAEIGAMQSQCQDHAEHFKSALAQEVDTARVMLSFLRASAQPVPQEAYDLFLQDSAFARPLVKHVSYWRYVNGSQRAQVEADLGIPFLEVSVLNRTGPTLWKNRSLANEYAVLVYVQEDDADAQVVPLGYDALSSAYNNPMFILSRLTGEQAFGPPNLFISGVRGFMGYYPDYGGLNVSNLSPEQRMLKCTGWVGAQFDAESIFNQVVSHLELDEQHERIQVWVIDTAAQDSGTPTEGYDNGLIYGTMGKATREYSVVVKSGGRKYAVWCSRFSHGATLVWKALGWGCLVLLLAALASFILWLSIKRAEEAERMVRRMEGLNMEMSNAKQAAEEANKAKSAFLTNISHELRTPMNGMIGMINLLMNTELDAQQQDYLITACSSGKALCALVDDFLDLSKIQAGKMRLESLPMDIRAELDSVLGLFEDRTREHRVELAGLVQEAVPKVLLGDPVRLRQVLVNLIGNAVKFTKTGSIFVCVRLAPLLDPPQDPPSSDTSFSGTYAPSKSDSGDYIVKVEDTKRTLLPDSELSLRPNALKNREEVEGFQRRVSFGGGKRVRVVVTVEDTGIGIPEHVQPQLFQPFVQGDTSLTREFGGTGIGLSLSKSLVTLMKGTITFKSKCGIGTTFAFDIELSTLESPPSSQSLPLNQPLKPNRNLQNVKVMVLGSHTVRQEIAASYLKLLGMQPSLPRTLEEALGVLKAKGCRAVFVDVEALGGCRECIEVLGQIAKVEKNVPVIAATCDAGRDSQLKAAGFSQVVVKPLRLGTLAVAMLSALGSLTPGKRTAGQGLPLEGKLKDKTIMVVDDLFVNRKVASAVLQRCGCTVVQAPSGEEAVEIFKQEKAFDLILMDLQMPGMDGCEASLAIRKLEKGAFQKRCLEKRECDNEAEAKAPAGSEPSLRARRVPIVALTADVMLGTREACQKADMDGYLTKPLDQKQLLEVVCKLLEEQSDVELCIT